jgi:hypothetical protein
MKKILITDGKGNYGHAIEKSSGYKGVTHLEVRMFDSYDAVHTTNWSSFLIYYEICDEPEGD